MHSYKDYQFRTKKTYVNFSVDYAYWNERHNTPIQSQVYGTCTLRQNFWICEPSQRLLRWGQSRSHFSTGNLPLFLLTATISVVVCARESGVDDVFPHIKWRRTSSP